MADVCSGEVVKGRKSSGGDEEGVDVGKWNLRRYVRVVGYASAVEVVVDGDEEKCGGGKILYDQRCVCVRERGKRYRGESATLKRPSHTLSLCLLHQQSPD